MFSSESACWMLSSDRGMLGSVFCSGYSQGFWPGACLCFQSTYFTQALWIRFMAWATHTLPHLYSTPHNHTHTPPHTHTHTPPPPHTHRHTPLPHHSLDECPQRCSDGFPHRCLGPLVCPTLTT